MSGKLRYVGRYIIEGRTLGKGNFAVVELATHSITRSKVAIKVIDRCKIKKEYVRRNLFREARILAQLRHPNVVRLYETISAQSSSLYCLVTEYAGGGDLLSYVRGQREGRLSEGVARPFVRQLVSALHHLHERGVVHRDLKMENIMLDEKKKNLKIVDFGLSNTFSTDCLLKTHCGSPEYAAPELFIADQLYGPEVDIWSLGINMFAMVTGRLPFSTPYTENQKQRLAQQIQNGLGVIHGREMAHLSEVCQDLLSRLIEPSPELRLPLLDIEVHPWLTNGGEMPFCPYQQPPKDLKIKHLIIEKMACLLDVSASRIESSIHEYRLDEASAVYNLMLDQYRASKGFWDVDHTIKREVKRPRTVEVVQMVDVTSPKPLQTSHQEKRDPGEEHVELRTPTIIGMVRPSQRKPERRTCLSADFELSAVSGDERPRQRRAKTATFPPTGSKMRPIGNATTANSVIARYNNFGHPPPSSRHHRAYSCPHTSPVSSRTPVAPSSKQIHPVEAEKTNQRITGAGADTVSKDEGIPPAEPPNSEGDGLSADVAKPQPISKEPINKQLIRKVQVTDHVVMAMDDRISKIKTNAESAHNVKVIDMSKYFNFKHGYIIKETRMSNSNSQKPQDSDSLGDSDLSSSNRERVSSKSTPGPGVQSWQSSHAGSPQRQPSSRSNDSTRQQMHLLSRPVNAHFCPHRGNPRLQESMMLAKRAWQARYAPHGKKFVRQTGKQPDSKRNKSRSVSRSSRPEREPPRARLNTPVATLYTTEDGNCPHEAQVLKGDHRRAGQHRGGPLENSMPPRLVGSGKSKTSTEEGESEEKIEQLADRGGLETMKKLQEMMSKDNVHQKVPNGNIRVMSAKMGTPQKPARSQSPRRKLRPSLASPGRAPSSDSHKSCMSRSYKGPYILDKHKNQHLRRHTHPACDQERAIDLNKQHMQGLLEEASVKFEETLKIAEQQHEPTAGNKSRHQKHAKQQVIHSAGPLSTNHSQAMEEEGTVALQLGQRVQLVKGSLAIKSKPPPVTPSTVAPERVFDVRASRDIQSDSIKDEHGLCYRNIDQKDWDFGYRLERKISDTIKRAGNGISKTPDLLLNCT